MEQVEAIPGRVALSSRRLARVATSCGSRAQVSSFGSAGWVAYRMSSLHPKRLGTRKNTDKRVFVGKHLLQLEYRVIALVSREDAGKFEQREMRPRRRRILSNARSRRAGILKLEQEFRKHRTVGGRWP